MKRIKLFFIVYLIAICACGCSHNLNEQIHSNISEKDAIYATFGEYNSTKGTGVVYINEKSDEKGTTYIFYLAQAPSLERYKKILKEDMSTEDKEKASNKIYEKVKQEAGEEVLSKINNLYTNKNVDKIRIEVGVKWPYGNYSYIKPGQKLVGEKLAYIKIFKFERKSYVKDLNEYNKQNSNLNKYIS